MKTLESILITLAVVAAVLALCGCEQANGSLSAVWFFGWAAAATLFGFLADKADRRARKC